MKIAAVATLRKCKTKNSKMGWFCNMFIRKQNNNYMFLNVRLYKKFYSEQIGFLLFFSVQSKKMV